MLVTFAKNIRILPSSRVQKLIDVNRPPSFSYS